MIMDWVHCNNCFQLPDPERRFFLTSCGHIFCKDCEAACAREACKLCGNKCTTIPLSSAMKPDVQIYFTDPNELLKAKLKEVHKIAAFQKNHRARLMTHYRKELNKYKQMKDGFKKILKNLKELESERKHISKENDNLKKFIEMSGLARSILSPSSIHGSGGSKKEGACFLPHEMTPSNSHMKRTMSDFLNKGASNAYASERLSVFTPPSNCKMGHIPGTPSPSAAFKNLRLNSASLADLKQNADEDKFCVDSQGSSSECNFNLRGDFLTPSPTDPWNIHKSMSMGYHNRRDPRRVVVHPYSPND